MANVIRAGQTIRAMSEGEFEVFVKDYREATRHLMDVYAFLGGGSWGKAKTFKHSRSWRLPETFDAAGNFTDPQSFGIPKDDFDAFVELHAFFSKTAKSPKQLATRLASFTEKDYAKKSRRKMPATDFDERKKKALAEFDNFKKKMSALPSKFPEFEKLVKQAHARYRKGGAGKLKKFDPVQFLSLHPPAGFTAKLVPGEYDKKKQDVVLSHGVKGKDEIEIRLTSHGSGHVVFDTDQGRLTFDRLGVDDSFYLKSKPTPQDVLATIKEQVERAKASQERNKTGNVIQIKLPRLTPRKTHAEIAELSKQLKNGESISFSPSGFGTGYTLATNPKKAGFDPKRADSGIAKIFDVPSLFYSEHDMD